MPNYIKVFLKHSVDSVSIATVKNVINNRDGALVYAEFVGDYSKGNNPIKRMFDEIKDPRGFNIVIENGGGYFKRKPNAKYASKIEEVGRKQAFGLIYDEESLRGKNAKILLGRTNEEVIVAFKKWLSESQPLPYLKGFNEELNMDAEAYLFSVLLERDLVYKLHDSGCDMLAYQLKDSLVGAGEDMQKAILKVIKDANLLEVDRIKKVLKKAPKIGEADSDKAKVYVSIKDLKDNKIYHAIEYTVSSDTVFCLVDKDGDILWEEHSFTALFSNEQTVILKGDEYKDIYLDVNGKVLAA